MRGERPVPSLRERALGLRPQVQAALDPRSRLEPERCLETPEGSDSLESEPSLITPADRYWAQITQVKIFWSGPIVRSYTTPRPFEKLTA